MEDVFVAFKYFEVTKMRYGYKFFVEDFEGLYMKAQRDFQILKACKIDDSSGSP